MNDEQKQLLIALFQQREKKESQITSRFFTWSVVLLQFVVLVYFFWSVYQARIIGEKVSNEVVKTVMATIFFCGAWVIFRNFKRTNEEIKWLMHALFFSPSEDSEGEEEKSAATHRWPWGDHHTEMLGHLEAAAKRFWTLYDPTQADTAPTNKEVAAWLRAERNVSEEKAQAIASILRPDGLRPGPRR